MFSDRFHPTRSRELSIVMPCLNESEALGTCSRKAQGFLREKDVDGEVIVADDGSNDVSPEIVRRAGARLAPLGSHASCGA